MRLFGRAWMDADGRHVWHEHTCANGKVERSMLPWPRWKNIDSKVHPSIACAVPGCNYHETPPIEVPPEDWKPRANT